MELLNNSCAFADIFRHNIIEDDLARLSATCQVLRSLLRPETGFPGEACMDYSIHVIFNNGRHIIEALSSGIIPCQKTITFILETQTLGEEFFSFRAIVKNYVKTKSFWESIKTIKIMNYYLDNGFIQVGNSYAIPTSTGYDEHTLVSNLKWTVVKHVVKSQKYDSDSDSDSDMGEFGDGERDSRWWSKYQNKKKYNDDSDDEYSDDEY